MHDTEESADGGHARRAGWLGGQEKAPIPLQERTTHMQVGWAAFSQADGQAGSKQPPYGSYLNKEGSPHLGVCRLPQQLQGVVLLPMFGVLNVLEGGCAA